MFNRQKTGSVVCRSCGLLVGVNEQKCYHCGAPYPGLWGLGRFLRNLGEDMGLIPLIAMICTVLYLLTLAVDPRGIVNSGLSILAPSVQATYRFGSAGWIPLFYDGRWWTLLSAGWLHSGVLHLGLNMYWLYQVGPPTAQTYGPGRMVIIYLAASITGFFASSAGYYLLGGAGTTLGASAAIFGLFGALVYAGKRGGSSIAGKQAQGLAVMLFIFGFFFPGVDNLAHAGGFGGGYLISRWLDPMLPERMNHLALAALGIVASLAAVVLSFLTPSVLLP